MSATSPSQVHVVALPSPWPRCQSNPFHLPALRADSRLTHSSAAARHAKGIHDLLSAAVTETRLTPTSSGSPQALPTHSLSPSFSARRASPLPFTVPPRPTTTLRPRCHVGAASFSTSSPLPMAMPNRHLQVFREFCKYLDNHDVSSATHKRAVWEDFKAQAPPKIVSSPLAAPIFLLSSSSPFAFLLRRAAPSGFQ